VIASEMEASKKMCCTRGSKNCIGSRCMAWVWAEPNTAGLSRHGTCGLVQYNELNKFNRATKKGSNNDEKK